MTTCYHVTRLIDAPAQAVWDLLTNASSYADWNPAVISIEGPIAAGSSIRLVSIVNPKRTFTLKVTEMQQPRHMVWADGMPLGLFKGVRTYSLADRGTGTEFAMTEQYSGLLAGLITRTIPDMTESFDQFADGLKQAAESAAT
jgi:hypothetical protein